MEVSDLEESDVGIMLIRVALQNGLPAYGDPRVLEGHFFQVGQDWTELWHQQNQTRSRVITNKDKLQDLLVNFKSFKKDFKHFITEHYNPMQKMVDELASRSCRCYNHIQLGGGTEPGWMFLRGHGFYLRQVPTPSSGSGSSPAPDLDSVTSSKDEGSFKTSRSEMQGVPSGSGNSDAAGGANPQAGVGVWDGHGEVGVGEGSSEEERSPSS